MFVKIAAALVSLFVVSAAPADDRFLKEPAVSAFIDKMSKNHGFDKKALRELFGKAQYVERAVMLMDRPAEALDWGTYMARVITDLRTADGVRFYKKYRRTLLNAQKKYGVPSYIITAILGIETSYGQITLRYRAFDALATLGFFYPRRAAYFQGELEALLLFSRKTKTDPFSYMSSYAGAVGIPQFMPSNISRYAVDGSKNGKIDIIRDRADAIYSVANYLKQFGWKKDQPVSVKVRLAGSGYRRMLQASPCSGKKSTVGALRKAGIIFPMRFDSRLPAVLFPVDSGDGKTEYHVAFSNFCVISKYNNSARYVLAVNFLGNRIGKRVGAVKARR